MSDELELGRHRLPVQALNVSDPTEMTQRQLHRELLSLRETIEARLDAMDKATVKFESDLTRFPTEIDKRVGQLQALHEQRFASIDLRFHERDLRFDAQTKASDLAIRSALEAQKEGTAKTEFNTTKQIDGIATLIATSNNNLSDKIAAVTARLDRTEGVSSGHSDSSARLLAIGGLAVSVVLALYTVSSSIHNTKPDFSVQPPATITARP